MASDSAVVRSTLLPAPREEVWRALTEPRELAEWLADVEDLDLEEGGRAVFALPDGEVRDVVFDAVEPERRLAFRWQADGEDASSVELTLEEAAPGTRLTVVERPAVEGPTALVWGGRLASLRRSLLLVAA
jgi:uncharacterized protein YndB with AHSA1/START domain